MSPSRTLPRHLTLLALAGAASVGGSLLPCAPASAAKAPPAQAETGRRITLDFVEADLCDVAKALSVQSGANIAVSSQAKGKITLRLRNTTLEDALRFVSRLAGMEYRQFEGTYVIGTADELRTMAARAGSSETWTPRFLDPEGAKSLVQTTLPFVTVQTQTNSRNLLLLGSPEDLAAARRLLTGADQPGARPRVTQTFQLQKASPSTLAAVLVKALPDLGVQVEEKTLILNGTTADLEQATNLIAKVDVEGNREEVTRVYTLKYLHPSTAQMSLSSKDGKKGEDNLFPDLKVVIGPEPFAPNPAQFAPLSIESKGVFGGQSVTSNKDSNGMGSSNGQTKSRMLILSGPADQVSGALQLLQALDVAPPQVLIEAKMVDVSTDRAKELGLDYDWTSVTFRESPVRGTGPGSGTVDTGGTSLRFGRFLRTPFDLNVTLKALETQRAAKLLANPKVSVIDSEDASIFIGDLLRYRVLQSVTSGGSEQFTIETVPVGVALLVRPRVHEDGNITLKVHPVVSTVTDFIGPERIPQTASREADSTIRMKDGETIVIGGLLREEELKILRQVPILGQLPLIGELFRSRDTQRRKSEVTVFLTARIIK
jgi:type II secretory pathway component GspD/PulD (secretin)